MAPNQPPAPPRGLDANAPLSQPPAPQDPNLAIADQLDGRFNAIVERVQNPDTRRRVTMRERGEGMISYVGAALLRNGARPKT